MYFGERINNFFEVFEGCTSIAVVQLYVEAKFSKNEFVHIKP